MAFYNLEYLKACLNCLKAEDVTYFQVWEGLDNEFENETLPKESLDFYAIYKIRKHLWTKAAICPFCVQKGCFDVWNLRVNGINLYTSPEKDTASMQVYIEKKGESVQGNLKPLGYGNLATYLAFFGIVEKIINGMPKSVFIEKEEGFIDIIVFYDSRTGNVDVNKFRCVGFGKENIMSLMNAFEEKFKKEYNIDF